MLLYILTPPRIRAVSSQNFSGDTMGYEGVPILAQTNSFLYAMALGAVLSLVYDVFRIIRVAFGGKKTAVFVEDLFFSIVALILTFVFVIAFNNGELRFFVLVGELVGFVICHSTIGRIIIVFSKAIINAIKWFLKVISTPFAKLFKRILPEIKQIRKKLSKTRKNHEKPLEISEDNIV